MKTRRRQRPAGGKARARSRREARRERAAEATTETSGRESTSRSRREARRERAAGNAEADDGNVSEVSESEIQKSPKNHQKNRAPSLTRLSPRRRSSRRRPERGRVGRHARPRWHARPRRLLRLRRRALREGLGRGPLHRRRAPRPAPGRSPARVPPARRARRPGCASRGARRRRAPPPPAPRWGQPLRRGRELQEHHCVRRDEVRALRPREVDVREIAIRRRRQRGIQHADPGVAEGGWPMAARDARTAVPRRDRVPRDHRVAGIAPDGARGHGLGAGRRRGVPPAHQLRRRVWALPGGRPLAAEVAPADVRAPRRTGRRGAAGTPRTPP